MSKNTGVLKMVLIKCLAVKVLIIITVALGGPTGEH